ncbi:hypothetical protein A6R68_18745 [Neotoma lepida]|uniref:Uncharacterized protein n=1 Tax=Neotoma lepida TaxID=56216 RepID=A0A1A6HK16_NEOLE|nr:hypothetical protein A6R68_18745 [Neotoma lepida]
MGAASSTATVTDLQAQVMGGLSKRAENKDQHPEKASLMTMAQELYTVSDQLKLPEHHGNILPSSPVTPSLSCLSPNLVHCTQLQEPAFTVPTTKLQFLNLPLSGKVPQQDDRLLTSRYKPDSEMRRGWPDGTYHRPILPKGLFLSRQAKEHTGLSSGAPHCTTT